MMTDDGISNTEKRNFFEKPLVSLHGDDNYELNEPSSCLQPSSFICSENRGTIGATARASTISFKRPAGGSFGVTSQNENIRVFLRMRPFNSNEQVDADYAAQKWVVTDEGTSITLQTAERDAPPQLMTYPLKQAQAQKARKSQSPLDKGNTPGG